MSRKNRSARTVTVLASAAAVLALGGCSWISPQTTTKHYDASDGISGNVGDVDIRNILVVSVGKDQPGQVLAGADNTGQNPVTLQISDTSGGSAGSNIELPAKKSVKIDPQGGSNVLLGTTGANPGETVNLKLSAGQDEVTLAVPVVDGTLAEYAPFVPAGSQTSGVPGITEPTSHVLETEAAQKYAEENPGAGEH